VVLAWISIIFLLLAISLIVIGRRRARNMPHALHRREAKRKWKLAKRLARSTKKLRETINLLEPFDSAMRRVPIDTTPEELVDLVRHQTEHSCGVHVFDYLELKEKSPLAAWMDAWFVTLRAVSKLWRRPDITHFDLRDGLPGWDASASLKAALKLQHQEWLDARDRILQRARELQLEVYRLSRDLEIHPEELFTDAAFALSEEASSMGVKVRVEVKKETPRDKLNELRVRIKDLREEESQLEEKILEEEQISAQGMYRRAAGILPDEND
jgi:hypothetical protein